MVLFCVAPRYDPKDAESPIQASGDQMIGGGFIFNGGCTVVPLFFFF